MNAQILQRQSLRISLGMIMLLVSGWALAEDAKLWLDRMSEAMQRLNYQGTFVYLHDNQLEAMRIEHGYDDQSGEHERLLSLNGEAREIIRDNNNVTCIWPGSKSVTVSKARPRKPFPAARREATELEQQYHFHLLGEARMAGLPSRVLAIEPRDNYRYGYRLWLERDSYLLLRSDLLDEMGRPIEQVMFTELEILPAIPVEHFRPLLQGAGYTWREEDSTVVMEPDPMWKVTALPPGFKLISRSKKPMPPYDRAVEHMVFSDGLASVSLFIEPLEDDQEKLIGVSNMGGVNVFGEVVGKYQVTVVGEVPAQTVEVIGKAVVHMP